jgi:hypothetical protein
LIATGFTESVDRRVLGGIVFVDAMTSTSIVDPLSVTGTSLKLRVNRSGVYAIFDAPGFTSLTSQFNPATPAWPAAQSFELTVRDTSGRYLARRAQVQAPQSLSAVSTPQPVLLYPGPSAPTAPNWALVRASVTDTGGSGLPWAVIRVIRADNSIAATGVTDARGEALLAVMGLGVQVSTTTTGSVTEITIPVTVQAWFDPGVRQQPPGWIPDPDDILGNLSNTLLKTGRGTGALGAGQVLLMPITIAV